MEVARYKIYERLLTVGELPLTKVGKVGKKALREIARDALMRPDAVTANQLASRESRQSIPGRKSARDKSLAHWLEREIARLRAGEPAADGPDTSHIRQPTDTMWMSQPRSQVLARCAWLWHPRRMPTAPDTWDTPLGIRLHPGLRPVLAGHAHALRLIRASAIIKGTRRASASGSVIFFPRMSPSNVEMTSPSSTYGATGWKCPPGRGERSARQ
jgi:hypothetical protein